jgi:hypothetical protein
MMDNEDKITVKLSPSKSFIILSEGNETIMFLTNEDVKEIIEKLSELSRELQS